MPQGNGNGFLRDNKGSGGSGINQAVSQTIGAAKRDKELEGLSRAEGNKGKLGGRAPSKSSSKGLENSKSNNANIKNRGKSIPQNGNLYKNAKKFAVESALKGALAGEIGPTAANMIVNSKPVQKKIDDVVNRKHMGPIPLPSMNDVKKVADKLPGLSDTLDGKELGDNDKDIDSSSDLSKKSDKKESRKIASGEISSELSIKTLATLLIVAPFAAVLLMISVFVIVTLNDDKTSSMIYADLAKDEVKKLKGEVGAGGPEDEVGKAATGIPKEYYDRINKLGNLFSSNVECSGNECFERPEFLYYLKIADIAYRYNNKYHVDLDWYLISATNLYFDSTTEEIMKKNIGGYDSSSVENINIVTSLDWDYDYKNIGGYQYLDADDSTYDLQILAKNMVKKKTVQMCTDSSGNVTKREEIEDVEDKYLNSGGSKVLQCSSGETYSYTNTYTKDMDKFDDFMEEYIEKKMLIKGSGKNNSGGNSGCVSTNSSYIWPIGSDDVINANGRDYALGEPYTIYISSRFGSKEGFRVKGHGAIDIAGVPGPGVTNVIAAKSGTVVYPLNTSQTGFADNGHLGNKDGGGYGNYVIIQHDDGNYTLYAHLAQNSIKVFAGDVVDQGQVIAKLGHSGQSTGPHLHFEFREGGNSSVNRADPLKYVNPENPRPGGVSSSNSCNMGENQDLADAFVNLALEQKNDPSADGGEKYRKYMLPDYNEKYHWCAAFVSWNIYNVENNGQKLSDVINYKSTWVYEFANNFYEAGQNNALSTKKFYYNDSCKKFVDKNGVGETYKPKKGDLIFFDWNNKLTSMPATKENANHIGIVNYVQDGYVYTIEGNSGDKVKENKYELTSCQIFGYGSWY